jgi:DtxR family transcriptional regulator, Mn-dependent transcriptional regulator
MADGFHPPLEEYLEAIHELDEEGMQVIQARLADRLGHSAPAVSEMIRRLKAEGYLTVEDRDVKLTTKGRVRAESVVRKHRLAERLLTDIIGLPWHKSHLEACRWEHVMSETVERRILELLGHPTTSPYGNPIPGLLELGDAAGALTGEVLVGLDKIATDHPQRVLVRRLGEPIQTDVALMSALRRAGVTPGAVVKVRHSDGGLLVGSGMEYAELTIDSAAHIFVVAK